jgi:hypothetical protein
MERGCLHIHYYLFSIFSIIAAKLLGFRGFLDTTFDGYLSPCVSADNKVFTKTLFSLSIQLKILTNQPTTQQNWDLKSFPKRNLESQISGSDSRCATNSARPSL